ncbi:MAG: RNA 2'-phosphotransferase, partial [Myxococcaceae bacterium]
ELEEVVRSGEKRRFELDAEKTKVRATHGHSVKVELDHEPKAPPEILFHGTVAESLESVRAQGLQPGDRQYVHLSNSREDAAHVAMRRGPPVIIEVLAGEMAKSGSTFFFAASGIWLTREVPPKFMRFP